MALRIWTLYLAGFAIPVAAQTNTATISGLVTDSQGAAIVGASVVATSVSTQNKYSAQSNESGFYSVRQLPVGSYTLAVEHPGFRKYNRAGLLLTTGQALELPVQLEVGAVTETVSVNAAASTLDTRTSEVSQLVEAKTLEDMPLGDRRAMNMINITGGTVFVNYDAGAKPNFSLAGGRTQSQNFFVDGGTGQNMRLGIGQMDFDPPVEVVQEVKILSNSYSAEYGGSAGGVVIATTKSGTNSLHGSLFEYLRNEKLDAGNYFSPLVNGQKQRAPLRYNVFGGTVGGPVVIPKLYNGKEKTFFFFAYEGSRRGEGAVRTLTVPDALQKSGDFSRTFAANGSVVPVYDPNTTRVEAGRTIRDQFPGNVVPGSRIDPVAANIVKYYPSPNRPADNVTGANNFRANYISRLTRDNYTAKVDHNLNSRDKLQARYIYNSDNVFNTSVFAEPAADTLEDPLRHQHYTFVSWTRVVSPSMVNDLRFTYSNRINWNRSKGVGTGAWVAALGIKGVPENAFPGITATGFQQIGSINQERQQFPIQQYQLIDNFSWVRGRHSMKFGFELRPSYNYEINRPTLSGAFTFSPLATGQPGVASSGNGLASLLVGFPTGFAARETQVLDRYSWYMSGFVQDDWQVSRDLTLNIGVRWEVDTPITDRNSRMNGFDTLQINPVSGTPGVIKFAGNNGWPASPYNTDWNNFGPRFGFAWKPFGSTRMVLRGGYGIFFAHPFDAGAPASASLGYENSLTLNSPDNGITAPFFLRNGVPGFSLVPPPLNDNFGAVRTGQNPNTAVTFYEANRATGYAQQFNLSAQREIGRGTIVEVSYLGNLSRKLPSSNLTLNQIHPSIVGPNTQGQAFRPYPQFSNVSVLLPPLGVSSYHALVARVEKRFSAGLNLLGTYTYSKFLNNTNEGGSVLGAEGGPYSDFYNRRLDWGPSENDVRHRVTFSSVYELPFGRGKKYLSQSWFRHIAGDWAVGTVVLLQAGAPFTVTTQIDTRFSNAAGALRADVSRNPNLGGERSIARWFDTAAFTQPANYRNGNQGVNILRADNIVNFDFSLLKNIPVGEGRKFQLRGEFFNTANHPDFGVPGRILGGPGFGVVASARPARRVQVGARFVF